MKKEFKEEGKEKIKESDTQRRNEEVREKGRVENWKKYIIIIITITK